MEYGLPITRWRIRGISRVPRSIRWSRASRSGRRSSTATAVIVDRRIGSFSMFHMSASLSLIRVSYCIVAPGV